MLILLDLNTLLSYFVDEKCFTKIKKYAIIVLLSILPKVFLKKIEFLVFFKKLNLKFSSKKLNLKIIQN